MKSTIGKHITLSLFGESHGEKIGVVIDGLPSGIALDLDFINKQMQKRKAKGKISTQRQEADAFQIVSGFFQGHTTGTPLTIEITNQSQHSNDYDLQKMGYRPSHADYSGHIKYFGYEDHRGGGHFSGRLSAPLVAAGAIALQILNKQGILIGTHIQQCHDAYDIPFAEDETLLQKQLQQLNDASFPVLHAEKEVIIKQEIEKAASRKDSVGGILESAILHLPPGIGEPFFYSLESVIAQYLYSIPAVKAISFGLGFDFASRYGSEANDAFTTKDGIVSTLTNHNGGINGGISNGMPIRIQTCIKPTPSIFQPQQTISRTTHEPMLYTIQGRHDPAILHRACVVVDSMLALAILDLYMEREMQLAFQKKKEGIQQ